MQPNARLGLSTALLLLLLGLLATECSAKLVCSEKKGLCAVYGKCYQECQRSFDKNDFVCKGGGKCCCKNRDESEGEEEDDDGGSGGGGSGSGGGGGECVDGKTEKCFGEGQCKKEGKCEDKCKSWQPGGDYESHSCDTGKCCCTYDGGDACDEEGGGDGGGSGSSSGSGSSESSGGSSGGDVDDEVEECCESKGLPDGCMKYCNVDSFDESTITKLYMNKDPGCGQSDMRELTVCQQREEDHKACCESAGVPSLCIDFCHIAGGLPDLGAQHLKCRGELPKIQKCMR